MGMAMKLAAGSGSDRWGNGGFAHRNSCMLRMNKMQFDGENINFQASNTPDH